MIRPSNTFVSGALAALLVLGMLAPAVPAHAQSFPMQSILQAIVGSVSNFLHLGQNTALSAEAIKQQELTARKNTVSQIYALTTMEQNDLQTRLTNLSGLSAAQTAMRDTLLSDLNENAAALRQINDRLAAATDIAAVQQLATDFKNWRTVVYDPKAARIVAFTFVFDEGPILMTAEQRLANVTSDLKARAADQASLTLLAQAAGKISQAKDLHDQATTLMMVALSTVNDPHAVLTADSPALALSARNTADAKTYTTQSLQDIQDAYTLFLKLGSSVQ
ncbi:hypothetical protein KGO95_02000 [Patescibacteria group bacterium]|nr:hypothetical protein [Patescibacteria group bacterium]